MALNKSIPTNKGVPAEYWKITYLTGNESKYYSDPNYSGVISGVISGYYTKAARTAGTDTLMDINFNFSFADVITPSIANSDESNFRWVFNKQTNKKEMSFGSSGDIDYSVPVIELSTLVNDKMATAYSLIKAQLPEFVDAVDDI